MCIRTTTACFTGHRRLREPAFEITDRIIETTESLIQSGYLTFCAGGARGFDALASEAVLTLQSRYPKIKLVLTLPFADQYRFERGWSKAEIEQYHRLQEKAAQTTILAYDYRPGMYQQRNRMLADASSVCIAYMTRIKSGAGYTVSYAQEQGLRIINLTDHICNTTTERECS